MAEGERRVGAVHEALAGRAELCIELHRQMRPAESIALAKRLQQFHPYFYEDPMLPDSPGLGIEFDDAALARLPARAMVPRTPIGLDGSVHDW